MGLLYGPNIFAFSDTPLQVGQGRAIYYFHPIRTICTKVRHKNVPLEDCHNHILQIRQHLVEEDAVVVEKVVKPL